MSDTKTAVRRFFKGSSVNLMYVPALTIFAIFLVWPVIQGAYLSTTSWDGYSPTLSSAGWSNYTRLVSDPNSVRAIIYLPVLISPVVMGTFYYLVFRFRQGALNGILEAFGGQPVAYLANSNFAIAVIVFINSFQFVGVSMIIYLSGLQSIPTEVHEAAQLDGVNGWQQFKDITWPMLHPAFAASVVINLIGGLKLYDIIKVLTDGGPGFDTNSVSTLIGRTYFGSQAAGYAAAQGVVLFFIIVLFTVITNRWLDRRATRVGL